MKQEFRNFCLKQKKINRYYYSKIIGKELYKMAKNYKRILFFIPLKDEVDIYWVLKKLRKERKEIFVPFMEDLSFKMVKYQLPLQKKGFQFLSLSTNKKLFQKLT